MGRLFRSRHLHATQSEHLPVTGRRGAYKIENATPSHHRDMTGVRGGYKVGDENIESFAKMCLAPSSEACKGKTGKEYFICKEQFIRKCKKKYYSQFRD